MKIRLPYRSRLRAPALALPAEGKAQDTLLSHCLRVRPLSRLSSLVALLFLSGGSLTAWAATYTWNATGSANWSVGPWTGGTPSSNLDNALVFNVTFATRSAANDLGIFDLNSLSLNNTSTGATQRNLGVSGNALNFVSNSSGVLPTLTINNSSTTTTVGTLTFSNDFTVTNALTITNSGSAAAGISGNITNTSGITIDGGGTGTLTFATSRIISGNGGVTFNAGSGTTSFGGNNTYTGGTIIASGRVEVQSDSAFSTGALAVNGGTLDLRNRQLVVGALSGDSSGVITSTHTSATISLTTNSSVDSTYAGSINKKSSGTGTVGLIKQGTGMLTLSGANTYDGATKINGGTLQYAKQASLYNGTAGAWTNTNILVSSGATLAFSAGDSSGGYFDASALNILQTNLLGSNAASQGFQSGSFIGLDTTNATGGSFTQGNAIVNSSGAGGGAVGLKKLGTGTLVLDKTNTYTGATTVSAGGLLVNGSITSAVTVNAGTFGGGGSSTGNITVGTGAGAGAIFAPGNNAVGSFTTTGSVSLLSDATYALEFDSSTGNFDKIVASGLTLASGGTHLAIADIAGTSAALTVGNTYTIFDGTSTSISGTFFGLADNSTITVGLNTFTINYNAGLDSRDIVLTVVTAIPEPSTYALLGAVGCLGCAALRRQGRRSGSPE